MRTGILSLLVAIGLSAIAFPLSSQARYALVIGNGDYTNVVRLKNPTNDATDVSASLRRLGYEVDLLRNATLEQMESAVVRLGARLSQSPGAWGFFFYAGHGVQASGSNFLIPVDADIKSENFLRNRALSAQDLLDTLQQAGNSLNIVVLDACRDNPFGWSRGGTRGLSIVAAQPAGSIVVYATSAGSIAQDGVGRNGLFTGQLLKNLEAPNIDVLEVFRRTGAGVMTASGNKQVPAIYSQFFGTAFISGITTPSSDTLRIPPPTATPPSAINNPDFGAVEVAPGSLRISLASKGTLLFLGREVPIPAGGVLPVNGLDPGDYSITVNYSDGKTETKTISVVSGQVASLRFEHVLRTPIPPVPKGMVSVTGGPFVLGIRPEAADALWPEWRGQDWFQAVKNEFGPPHRVTVGSFAIAVTTVTRALWSQTTGTGVVSTAEADLPVTDIDWLSAVKFCNRLSISQGLSTAYRITESEVIWDRSSVGYRLPTEAEWEYAARGGHPDSVDVYSGSSSAQEVGWFSENSGSQIHPVGQKQPNILGLYDMSGNVWQWCWDWLGNYSDESQSAPSGPEKGQKRVLRGGSWANDATAARLGYRFGLSPNEHNSSVGFRVVRSLYQ